MPLLLMDKKTCGSRKPHPMRKKLSAGRLSVCWRRCRRFPKQHCTAQLGLWLLILVSLTGSIYMNTTLMNATYNTARKLSGLELELKYGDEPVMSNEAEIRGTRNSSSVGGSKASRLKRIFKVLWYNPPPYLTLRPKVLTTTFKSCKYSNCRMSLNYLKARQADVVLFDGRWVPKNPGFERPRDQIWVFAAHESPASFYDQGNYWTKDPWIQAFNWTMTYDRKSDIFLPYGELSLVPKRNRNYVGIAFNKSKSALWISSHCYTRGKREEYVRKLRHFIDIDILGDCGQKWDCGTRFVHDDCFNILNTTYKFYLAFENALCRDYFSEKFYDNYNYDIIQVTRGGLAGNSRDILPHGTHIPSDGFDTVEDLGLFLKKLNENPHDYASFLESKDRYISVGYKYVYQRALCNICERMNALENYQSWYPNITSWAFDDRPCSPAQDLR